ncbi:PEGA domain-containing protein [Candidatus Saccharibacteria bacterium]|nr:PEGA domain-containing protein [Candidatus Saccharibacteria bacterium]
MDKERRKKIQATKLIITEVFMIVTIVLTVVILTFIVMGYRLNEDGKLEQSGLVGVESIPTGATVKIDDEILPNKTNTSKILPEGEYTILLEKEGYTSWTKTFKTHSGFLTKLAYPRLYKIDRQIEPIEELGSAPTLYSISPSRNTILYSDGLKLYLMNIDSNAPKPIELDLPNLFQPLPTDLKVLAWSENSERIIFSLTKNDRPHFVVIDLARPEYSLDLTATFNLTISELGFITSGGDSLFILENGNLRTISLATEQLSSVLLSDVESFMSSGSKAIVVQTTKDNIKKISLYDHNSKSTILLKQTTAEIVRALVSEYLGRFTLAFLENGQVTVYRGELPTEDITKDNPLPSPVGEYTLDFGVPSSFETVAKNQVILASKDADFTVFDLETYSTSSYRLEGELTFWPDNYIIGEIAGGELVLRDFDGGNRQVLGRSIAALPAVISKDGKYLYYVSENYTITRENIK